VCKRARAYLTAKGIGFREYDVEKDPTGKRHYRQMMGRGVPILVVGGRRMNGFSPRRLEVLLAEARGG
jgi:glutaredoxin